MVPVDVCDWSLMHWETVQRVISVYPLSAGITSPQLDNAGKRTDELLACACKNFEMIKESKKHDVTGKRKEESQKMCSFLD